MATGRLGAGDTAIQPTILDAKGDLIVATAADTPARLAVGTNEQRLVADSATATGLKYVADTTNYAIAAKGDLLVGTAADTLAALTVGSANQVLTVDSSTATGLKWAAASAPTAQGVSCENSTDTTLTSGVYTTITFNTELFDTDGFHSTSTNTSRLTVPTGLGGKYLINFLGYVNPNATGDFIAKFQVNGGDRNRWAHKVINAEPFSPALTSVVSLNANDYVEVLCYHNLGGNLLMSTYLYGQFSMFRIGA